MYRFRATFDEPIYEDVLSSYTKDLEIRAKVAKLNIL